MKNTPTPSAVPVAAAAGAEPSSGVRRRAPSPAALRAFLAEVRENPDPWRNGIPRHLFADLLHNAFVRVLEHQDEIAPESREAYLRTALLHEKLHSIEQEARREAHAPDVEAHLRARGSALPPPDATVSRQELCEAVVCLLEQVEPERRAVVGWCLWRALHDDPVTLDELAQALEVERGTLGSQWARGKEDMAAACRREHAKPRGKSKLAALLSTLAAVWLWLGGRGRAWAGTLTRPPGGRPGAPDGPAMPASPRRPPHGRGRVHWTCAALACAVLAIVLLAVAWRGRGSSPGAIFVASFEATTVGLAAEAREEGDAQRRAARTMFAPALATNAEREPEWGISNRTARTAGAPRSTVADPIPTPSQRQRARGLLARATDAIATGHLDVARDALSLYDAGIPGNPFPAERADLGVLLAAQGAR